MEKKQVKKMIRKVIPIILPIILVVAYVMTKDKFFLSLVAINLVYIRLKDKLDKTDKVIVKIIKKIEDDHD